MLVQRKPSIQFCFHDAVPTQPIMQERTFKFLFNKRGQTELKQSLVEMQLNVDLTNCHGSVPVSNFREVSENGSSTFLCFSLPYSVKEGKAMRMRGLHKGKNHKVLPWKNHN